MSQGTPKPEPTPPRAWKPRFGLAILLVVMLVLAVVAAAGGYLVRAMTDQGQTPRGFSKELVFILFALSAPMFLMVALSLCRQLVAWLNRPRRR